MKTLLLLPLALSLTFSVTSLTTNAQTLRAGSVVCIPEAKARLITAELQRLPAVLGENRELRTANGARRSEVSRLRTALTAQDTVIAATERRVVVAGMLGRDAENRAGLWKRKAKSRWWLNVGLGVVALLFGAAAVR